MPTLAPPPPMSRRATDRPAEAPPAPPVVLAEDLTKTFTTETVETTALAGVDLTVAPGEFVAVMGPSGCGKSTLLNVLGLLTPPTSGRLEIDGVGVAALSRTEAAKLRRGRVGFVFQGFNLIDELTVAENVELPLQYLRTPAAERRGRVEEVLDRVGMAHRLDHYPKELSGGQQQRVAVARAVVARPPLVLADEPTGNLDSASGEQTMELLAELNADGTTVVMVTHSARDAEFAYRTVHLFDGHVVADGVRPDPLA